MEDQRDVFYRVALDGNIAAKLNAFNESPPGQLCHIAIQRNGIEDIAFVFHCVTVVLGRSLTCAPHEGHTSEDLQQTMLLDASNIDVRDMAFVFH